MKAPLSVLTGGSPGRPSEGSVQNQLQSILSRLSTEGPATGTARAEAQLPPHHAQYQQVQHPPYQSHHPPQSSGGPGTYRNKNSMPEDRYDMSSRRHSSGLNSQPGRRLASGNRRPASRSPAADLHSKLLSGKAPSAGFNQAEPLGAPAADRQPKHSYFSSHPPHPNALWHPPHRRSRSRDEHTFRPEHRRAPADRNRHFRRGRSRSPPNRNRSDLGLRNESRYESAFRYSSAADGYAAASPAGGPAALQQLPVHHHHSGDRGLAAAAGSSPPRRVRSSPSPLRRRDEHAGDYWQQQEQESKAGSAGRW